MKFGCWLRRRRTQMRLRQKDVGEILGVRREAVNAWETRKNEPCLLAQCEIRRRVGNLLRRYRRLKIHHPRWWKDGMGREYQRALFGRRRKKSDKLEGF